MAKDIASLTRQITEFRQIFSKDSISPETLGFLLQSILDTLDDTVFQRVGSLEGEIARISANEVGLAAANRRITTNADNIAATNDRITTNANNISAANDRITKNANNIAAANDRITTNVERIDEAHRRITVNVERIDDAHRRITANADQITEANTRITTNVDQLKKLVSDLNALSASLSNHRSTEFLTLKETVDSLVSRFDTLLDGDTSDAIDNYNEIVSFLDGLKDSDSLALLLTDLDKRISGLRGEYDATTREQTEADHRKHGIYAVCKPVSFEAGPDGAAFVFESHDLNGEDVAGGEVELPVAFPPSEGSGVVRPTRGGAGIISGEDYGRFSGAADFTERLASATALGDIGFSASADAVRFTRPKYRLDGQEVWVDDDGNPVMVPAGGLWPFPMASETQAGAVTATQAWMIANAAELAFRELWKSAGCSVKEEADPSEMYVCNGLGMSYAEARAVYALGLMTNDNRNLRYAQRNVRTHLPTRLSLSVSTGERTFYSSKVEVVNAPLLVAGVDCFYDCQKLKSIKVYSPNTSSTYNPNTFGKCYALEELRVTRVNARNIWLGDSPLLSVESFRNIIAATQGGMAAFVVTVHPDVYAKMTDTDPDADPLWLELPTLAAEKNITFTTTE